jgi:nickel-dependent lactate racemase
MRIAIPLGPEDVDLELPNCRLVELHRSHPRAEPLDDPVGAVRFALEHPHNFPPLRRALTASDRVAVVVDEELPRPATLLTPILEHVTEAGVSAENITLLCPAYSTGQDWLEELPDEFEEVHVEVHQPEDRSRLSYLAATHRGRRLYLNRSLVEADQVIVMSGRGYDPLSGYSGAESMLFPEFSDQATRRAARRGLSLNSLGDNCPMHQEAVEVAWLLGAPFLVQVLVGEGEQIIQVLTGLVGTSLEGQQQLDSEWRVRSDRLADVVIATVSGDAGPHDFTIVARALGNAARAVKSKGIIVLLSRRRPDWPLAEHGLLKAGNPSQALQLFRDETAGDSLSTFTWISATLRSSVYLLSALPEATIARYFVTPMPGINGVKDLIPPDSTCLYLPSADRTLVDVGVTAVIPKPV